MRIVTKEHKIEYYKSGVLDEYFKDMRWCVFDIETMGLNPRYNEVVLAAIMSVEEDGTALVTQYFLDSMEEEPLLLDAVRDELNKFDVMLTFNGKHFDLPFIKTRAHILGRRDITLEEYDIRPFNLDLYLILYGHSELKKILPNLKQKSVEKYMGLSGDRDDEISGAESIELFKQYLSTFDFVYREKLGEKILLHNHDDVMQLYRLLPSLKKTYFHRAMSSLGFPVDGVNGFKNMTVDKVTLSGSSIIAAGSHCENFSYISFESAENNCSAEFKHDGKFRIQVPTQIVKKGINNAHIVNLRHINVEEEQFKNLPGYVNGFLLISLNDKENYREMNVLIKEIIRNIMKNS